MNLKVLKISKYLPPKIILSLIYNCSNLENLFFFDSEATTLDLRDVALEVCYNEIFMNRVQNCPIFANLIILITEPQLFLVETKITPHNIGGIGIFPENKIFKRLKYMH